MTTKSLVKEPFIKHVTLPQLYGSSVLKAISGQGSLNINIKKIYTDENGTVISKAAAPAALRTKLPIFLLGNFDGIGAHSIGFKTLKNVWSSADFLMTFVNGVDQPFLWNSGFNTLRNSLNLGDIVDVWTDDLDNPTAFAFIVQTCDYGSLASIVANTMTQQDDGKIGIMTVQNINYQVDVESQLQNVWQVVKYDNLGQFQQQSTAPLDYKNPYWALGQFIQVPLGFVMTQFVGLNFIMDFESDKLQVNFLIKKS